jgi:hypothetical protein
VSEPGHFAIFAPSIFQYGNRKMVTRLVAVGNGQVGEIKPSALAMYCFRQPFQCSV